MCLSKFLSDRKNLIETFFSIKTENEGIRPFIFNKIQSIYWKNRTRRDIILKSRRDGITSLKVAEGHSYCITNTGWNTKIVTHTPESMCEIMENILKVQFTTLPERICPVTQYNNSYEITFPRLHSKVSITTAGASLRVAQNVGRSEQINFLHFSEYAFYAFPVDTFVALTNCVPLQSGYISIESTPNSFNDFYLKVEAARKKKSSFKLHFFRWFSNPKNKLEEEENRVKFLTNEEKYLVDKHELTDAQVAWRRFKLKDYSLDRFQQEYPEDIISCFLIVGRPFFKKEDILYHQRNCLEPFDGYEEGVYIFVKPEKDIEYVIGVDVSEGLLHSDYDSADVLNRETGEQVAKIYGLFHPKVFANKISKIGLLYNRAMIAVERNNHGHTVLLALIEIEHYPKNCLYHKKDYDEDIENLKVGWETNSKTRPIMFDEYEEAFRKRYVVIHHDISVAEHFNFIYDDNGTPRARDGSFDDCITSLAIAWQARKQRKFKQEGY